MDANCRTFGHPKWEFRRVQAASESGACVRLADEPLTRRDRETRRPKDWEILRTQIPFPCLVASLSPSPKKARDTLIPRAAHSARSQPRRASSYGAHLFAGNQLAVPRTARRALRLAPSKPSPHHGRETVLTSAPPL